MEYVLWIVLREVLAGAHFLQLEANLGEAKKIEICYKLEIEHTGLFTLTISLGGKSCSSFLQN